MLLARAFQADEAALHLIDNHPGFGIISPAKLNYMLAPRGPGSLFQEFAILLAVANTYEIIAKQCMFNLAMKSRGAPVVGP